MWSCSYSMFKLQWVFQCAKASLLIVKKYHITVSKKHPQILHLSRTAIMYSNAAWEVYTCPCLFHIWHYASSVDLWNEHFNVHLLHRVRIWELLTMAQDQSRQHPAWCPRGYKEIPKCVQEHTAKMPTLLRDINKVELSLLVQDCTLSERYRQFQFLNFV